MALCLGVKEAAICGAPATCGRAAPASPYATITKHRDVLVFSPRRRSGNGPVTRLLSASRVELLDCSLSTRATLHQTDCDSNGARAEAAGSSARLRTEASTSGPLLVSARQTHASRRGAASGDARLTLAAPSARVRCKECGACGTICAHAPPDHAGLTVLRSLSPRCEWVCQAAPCCHSQSFLRRPSLSRRLPSLLQLSKGWNVALLVFT